MISTSSISGPHRSSSGRDNHRWSSGRERSEHPSRDHPALVEVISTSSISEGWLDQRGSPLVERARHPPLVERARAQRAPESRPPTAGRSDLDKLDQRGQLDQRWGGSTGGRGGSTGGRGGSTGGRGGSTGGRGGSISGRARADQRAAAGARPTLPASLAR
ncbi:hypothetical protein A5788_08215 [Gordonia sp. 852002-50816_SCH5313054-c]|nr:hypothetical protein A5785_12010 [Gordonia sp. 852002-50395_SCH5434458]OBC16949.1 hypothetical protein A5786_19405 [Gordonia sp. 852002-50816_SCH5313054-a]OBC19575.1 hypothetical protein A5788_08215 [Gordonia sp. 852002-50816_SCH5313054-c]